MKRIFITLLLCAVVFELSAQTGSLLLIGGGSEKDTPNSWNQAAYSWAVSQSENKRVAIIAYGAADNWLPDCFINSCGASVATNFDISSATTANAQTTYDELITYDVIFLKGGDQFNYYNTYKDTKTAQAIAEVYQAGGVVCGTSAGLAVLGEVDFIARNGSAYPNEVLTNPQHPDITLANDFLPILSGVITDSHFTRRARFPRLVAFINHWAASNEEILLGVGVDEMTAMGVTPEGVGTVYGIGSVNVYHVTEMAQLSLSAEQLSVEELEVTQLLQGTSYNFDTQSVVSGYSNTYEPPVEEETGNYTVLVSGTDDLTRQSDFLGHFANVISADDQVLILTGSDLTAANEVETQLSNQGVLDVSIYSATPSTGESQTLAGKIESADAFVFVQNASEEFLSFLHDADNGQLLEARLKQTGTVSAFVGSDSRYAGKTVVTNYLAADAAYYGEFNRDKGLALLATTCIIPNTFIDPDLYENTAAAVPYAMVTDTLRFGVWLSADNFMQYAPNGEETWFTAFGASPVMVLDNRGTSADFSQQTAYGDEQDNPPNYAGFERMYLTLFHDAYKVGTQVATSVNETKVLEADIHYQPSSKRLLVNAPGKAIAIRLLNMRGQVLVAANSHNSWTQSIGDFPSGIYVVEVRDRNISALIRRKIVHMKG